MRKRLYLIFLLLALPLTGIIVLGILGTHKFNALPYFTVNGMVDSLVADAHRVGEFQLINHKNQPYGSVELEGSLWIAAFFATNADHAATTTKQLLWPNFRYRNIEGINIVCFTLDPEYDQPEILNDYVEANTRYNGVKDKWQFLTGEKAEIDKIIREEFMIERDSLDPNNVATLWLVDGDGYLRGVYHAASENALRDATEDIALLRKHMDLKEYNERKAREKVEEINSKRPTPKILGTEGHTVPSFAFMGIDSVEVTHRDIAGKITIVDYFFTHCPTICPLLSSQLARTQEILKSSGITEEDVMILSHSVDPERDTPARMKEYAEMMNADTAQWKFLTGEKEDLYDQARHGYFLTAMESDTAAGGFFHSDVFALIDDQSRIRGFYDGTSTLEVDEMILDIHKLLSE
jgi:protein SCO1/2